MTTLRTVCILLCLLVAACVADDSATVRSGLGTSPYPASSTITSLVCDFSTLEDHGEGSDQWVNTVGADGNVYAMWGDGFGWSESGMKMFIGVTRIDTAPPNASGTDLWGFPQQGGDANNYKPGAFIADANGFHGFCARKRFDNWDGTYACFSPHALGSGSYGAGWTLGTTKIFSRSADGVRVVGMLQLGAGYTGGPAGLDTSYFYVYLGDYGAHVYLARVPRAGLYDRTQYEYFTGTNASNQAQWSSNYGAKQAVFSDPAGMEFQVNVVWNAGLGRYLYMKGQTGSDNTDTSSCPSAPCGDDYGLFEGPTPWGPWETVYYGDFLDEKWKFTYMMPSSWMSSGGQTVWMTISGWPAAQGHDDIKLVRCQLTTGSTGVCGDGTVDAGEACDDGNTNSCDGCRGDCGATESSSTFYADGDVDGYGNASVTASGFCAPGGYVADSSDCNDADSSVNPGAAEVCGDGIDQDCSGADQSCGGGSNLFTNPGFESGVSGWSSYTNGTPVPVSSPTHSGSGACRVDQPATGTGGAEQAFAVTPGDNYTLEAWVRTQNVTNGCGVRLSWNDASGRWIRSDTSAYSTGTTGWVRRSITATAPSNAATLHAVLRCISGGGTAWYDDAALTGPGGGASCGNGALEAGEACDDGNTTSCDGCRGDCGAIEGLSTWYLDADGDGFGDAVSGVSDYCMPPGHVTNGSDCDDGDPNVHPGATEVCGDGIDQDCSGSDLSCSGGNLLSNPSFEAGISSWSPYNIGSPQPDGSVVRTGAGSCRIAQVSSTGGAQQVFSVTPGTSYTIEAWVQTSNVTGGCGVRLGWHNASGNWIRSSTSAYSTGTTGWVRRSVTGTAPSNAATVHALLRCLPGSGTAWYDDAELRSP